MKQKRNAPLLGRKAGALAEAAFFAPVRCFLCPLTQMWIIMAL
jgi:hypothetical protein